MKKINIFAVLMVFSLASMKSPACSVVTVSDNVKTITGYTMDWVGQVTLDESNSQKYLGGGVFLLNSGVKKRPAFDVNSKFTWTSKYKSLVLSTLGPAYGFNGINEVGLEVYELGPPALIRDTNANLPAISEGEFVSLILDTASNIDEVISILKSVHVVQQIFPIQTFIKDRTGRAIIVDYKSGLRIHEAKPGESFVTNNWYDDEQYNWKNHIPTPNDPRASYIGDHATSPNKVESVITAVGSRNMTMWQSFSTVQNNKLIYTVRVNSLKVNSPELTKDFVLDLDQLFSSANYPKSTQVILLSDILKDSAPKFRNLEKEELRLIQNVNLKSINNWADQLFSRNAERGTEIYNNFVQLEKLTESSAFDNTAE